MKLFEREKLPGSLRRLYKDGWENSFPEGEKSLLLIHLPGAVPDTGVVLALARGNCVVLQLKPGLDQVKRVHDHHFYTTYKIISMQYKLMSWWRGL